MAIAIAAAASESLGSVTLPEASGQSSISTTPLSIEVNIQPDPVFTFKRRLHGIDDIVSEKVAYEAAERKHGPSWHSIGRTKAEADAEKQVKSTRKVIYDELDRLATTSNPADAHKTMRERYECGSWVENEKKRTLTNFISVLRKEKKSRVGGSGAVQAASVDGV